jgi:hypothetical protein
MNEGKTNWMLILIVIVAALSTYIYLYTTHSEQSRRIQQLEENIQFLEYTNLDLEGKLFFLEHKKK